MISTAGAAAEGGGNRRRRFLETVRADHGDCPDMETNTKCGEDGRLFVLHHQTLEFCHKKCLHTPDCAYYSFGTPQEAGSYANMCMGCPENKPKEAQTGINLYTVNCDSSGGPESCPNKTIDAKCPAGDGRLFILQDETVESCQQKCRDTPNCAYYSYGTEEAGIYARYCIACTQDANKETHVGFNLYPLDCSEPQSAPNDDDEGVCPHSQIHTKCPHEHEDRLFSLSHQTPKSCQKKCQETPNCAYYSFGDEEAGIYANVCSGCTQDINKETHVGFKFFSVNCTELEPPREDQDVCPHMHIHTKCPSQYQDRLYMLNYQTLDSCRKACKESPGCKYFSYGTEQAGVYQNVCMGCTREDSKETHTGFNFYAVNCTFNESESTATAGANGDPHFTTFSGFKYDFHGGCDLVLIHSPDFAHGLGLDVHVRTKINTWWSFIETAAVRLGENILEITGGTEKISYYVDGVKVEDMQNGDGSLGDFAIRFKRHSRMQSQTRIDLGNSDALSIETYKHFIRVNVKATHGDAFKGSYGMLGSYPGGEMVARDKVTIMNDVNEFGHEWMVLESEPKLFQIESNVQPPMKCHMPDVARKTKAARRLLGDSSITEEDAALACARAHETDRSACMFDVMATQDEGMAGTY